MPAAFCSTTRLVLLVKEEGKTRKLWDRVSRVRMARPDRGWGAYPVMIMKLDSVAAPLQYHRVRSRSLYKSIRVRRGFHFGKGAMVDQGGVANDGGRDASRCGSRVGMAATRGWKRVPR